MSTGIWIMIVIIALLVGAVGGFFFEDSAFGG